MIPDLSLTDRQHLAIQKETAPMSLIRKRCACGKACPAKQLVQYGACVLCVRAASTLPTNTTTPTMEATNNG